MVPRPRTAPYASRPATTYRTPAPESGVGSEATQPTHRRLVEAGQLHHVSLTVSRYSRSRSIAAAAATSTFVTACSAALRSSQATSTSTAASSMRSSRASWSGSSRNRRSSASLQPILPSPTPTCLCLRRSSHGGTARAISSTCDHGITEHDPVLRTRVVW